MSVAAPVVSPSASTAALGTQPKARNVSLRRQKFKWVRRLLWICVLASAVFAVAAFARAKRAVPLEVQVVVVQRASVRDFVTSAAAGRVSGKQEATLRADFAGTVRVLHHRRGERVKKGDPLVSYDAAELRERLRVAESAVGISSAQSVQSEHNAELARANRLRGEQLYAARALSQAEHESLVAQASALTSGAEAARASVLQARANVDLARNALSKAIVRAPFDGIILSTAIEIGETSLPGTPLLTIADVSALHVDTDIDEANMGRIAVGMPADVVLDAFPGERIHGTLSMIPPSVTRDAHGGRSVLVEVALEPDPRLRVGMSADVDVIVAVHDRTLWVPPNAVLGRGAERTVYVVKDGIAHKRTIEPGITTWEAVEIKSGLAEGDEVITTLDSTQLRDGMRVTSRRASGAR